MPPMKVMRKRLNGVYRADSGFSGPTRRYVLIVAMLVGLASVPTLAAITAGSNELADGTTDTMDVPFLPPASPGPIQSPPTVSPDSGSAAAQSGEEGAGAALRAGRVLGEAGERQSKVKPGSRYDGKPSPPVRSGPAVPGFAALPGMPRVPRLPSVPGDSASAPDAPTKPARPARPAKPADPANPVNPGNPANPAKPVTPEEPAKPARPGVPARPAEPTNPWEPTRPDGRKSPSLPPMPELPDVPDDPDDRDVRFPDDHGDSSEEPAGSDNSGNAGDEDPDEPPAHTIRPSCPDRGKRPAIRSHARLDDRARHRRRSVMAERPSNIRPSSILERSYGNSGNHGRRVIPEARAEDNQIANRSYRGSHRAGSMHHADDHTTAAEQRSSRVGRHHAEPTEDITNRW
ncbi:MAG: hypothetical protein ABW022_16465 [Actinoplanes sp.]